MLAHRHVTRQCRPGKPKVAGHQDQPRPGYDTCAEGKSGNGTARTRTQGHEAHPGADLDRGFGHLQSGDEAKPVQALEVAGCGGGHEDEQD